MTSYRCPRCGKKGSLFMSEHIDRSSGKIFWRIRMGHKGHKDCLLAVIKPENFKGPKRTRKKGSRGED
jgi:hypothetical protein